MLIALVIPDLHMHSRQIIVTHTKTKKFNSYHDKVVLTLPRTCYLTPNTSELHPCRDHFWN